MAVAVWISADHRYLFEGFQRGMLAQLAARLQARHTDGGTGEVDGVPVIVDDNCAVWSNRIGPVLGETLLMSLTDHVELIRRINSTGSIAMTQER